MDKDNSDSIIIAFIITKFIRPTLVAEGNQCIQH